MYWSSSVAGLPGSALNPGTTVFPSKFFVLKATAKQVRKAGVAGMERSLSRWVAQDIIIELKKKIELVNIPVTRQPAEGHLASTPAPASQVLTMRRKRQFPLIAQHLPRRSPWKSCNMKTSRPSIGMLSFTKRCEKTDENENVLWTLKAESIIQLQLSLVAKTHTTNALMPEYKFRNSYVCGQLC